MAEGTAFAFVGHYSPIRVHFFTNPLRPEKETWVLFSFSRNGLLKMSKATCLQMELHLPFLDLILSLHSAVLTEPFSTTFLYFKMKGFLKSSDPRFSS